MNCVERMLGAVTFAQIISAGISFTLWTGSCIAGSEGESGDPILAEFLAVAEKIERSSDPYLGRAQIGNLGERLEGSDVAENPARVAALHGQLSFEHLRLGEVERAIGHMETVFSMAEERGLPPTLLMHRLRVMVELRRAEVANCIQRHNRDCCLFPLGGGGVHAEAAPARRARESLLAILGEQPDLGDAQWLLNIVAMALGDHPEGVPKRFRIPAGSLESEAPQERFVDAAPALGVDRFDLCGGVVVEDFDGDGLLDIVTSSSDPRMPLALYRNGGDGSFTDIAAAAGLGSQLGGLNCIGADFDNDGDVDLLVLRGAWMGDLGRIRNSLLRNEGAGEGSAVRFSDVTRAAGLAEPAYPTQAAVWGDFDLDGDLDLFIGNESRIALDPAAESFPSQLFRNNGDGTFTEIGAAAGVANRRLAKGVSAGDYDNDGDLDLYVSNIGPNRLYRNDTPRGVGAPMRFTDVAADLGVAAPEGRSFVPWFFDYNNDGWLDLFVAAYDATTANVMRDYLGVPHGCTAPCLYLNRGGEFENVARGAGLDHAYLPMGASFGDVDGDGFPDIYLATGDPAYETLMPNVMLRNKGGRSFVDVTTAGGFGHLQKGHGIAFVDLDHDGDQDLYHQLGGFFPGDKFHNALFLNPGRGGAWLDLELCGTKSNRSGVGSRVTVRVRDPAGDRVVRQAIGSVSSFGGSPTGRFFIGLGDAESITELRVGWPSGEVSTFGEVPLGLAVRVTEGEANYESFKRPAIRFKVEP